MNISVIFFPKHVQYLFSTKTSGFAALHPVFVTSVIKQFYGNLVLWTIVLWSNTDYNGETRWDFTIIIMRLTRFINRFLVQTQSADGVIEAGADPGVWACSSKKSSVVLQLELRWPLVPVRRARRTMRKRTVYEWEEMERRSECAQ